MSELGLGGGGYRLNQNFLIKKMRIWGFFVKGALSFPKGCYHKKLRSFRNFPKISLSLRPVKIEENHVDKTLFVQPSIGLVKVLRRNHDGSHFH